MARPETRLRSHVTATAAVAAVFFAALVILVLVNRGSDVPVEEPSPTPTVQAERQETLLVQVTLARVRTASLLTATGGEPDRAVLLSMPADMLLVDGPNYTPLLDANLSLNRRLTAQAAENTLGVDIDGGWRMERKALAGLVDVVGGVTVTLAGPTVFYDEENRPVLELPAGDSLLPGPEASWYVMGVVEGEDPVAGVQTRFAEVFTKTVVQLPADTEDVAAILSSLGSLSDPLNGSGSVAAALIALREELLAGRISTVVLPFRPSGAADPIVTRGQAAGARALPDGAFRVTDYAAATPMLREAFSYAPRIADVDGPPRVLVWNASGEPLATRVALLELADADFIAISAGERSPVAPVTRIHGLGYSADGVSYSAGVAEALRLTAPEDFGQTGTISPVPATPAPAVSMPPADRVPWADVDVEFGQDYRPCPPDRPDCLQEVQ